MGDPEVVLSFLRTSLSMRTGSRKTLGTPLQGNDDAALHGLFILALSPVNRREKKERRMNESSTTTVPSVVPVDRTRRRRRIRPHQVATFIFLVMAALFF